MVNIWNGTYFKDELKNFLLYNNINQEQSKTGKYVHYKMPQLVSKSVFKYYFNQYIKNFSVISQW